MSKPELLAPAGEWEAFQAAVQNGADAVYMGGRNFSARQSAANFDRDELARAVEYAHARGVRVYVTVNTLVANEEVEPALAFMHYLHNTGVDAVIVQDAGLLRLAAKVLPELELHASTQMTVHNSDGARLLRDAGVDRIVLARELNLEEIREIKTRTGVEVEVFIHGALCICFSGQCLMSSMIGGRSGNRGRCAQPCRLPYRLEDRSGNLLHDPARTGEYLLSPRDLNLSEHIPGLAGAGVDAFKIEGRLKRPEYVATVTRVYRALIDRANTGEFYITREEKTELAQIFNRDFTTGYLLGRPGEDLMSSKRPNNRGLMVGRVKKYYPQKGEVDIELDMPLRQGDGLEIWVSRGGRVGAEVHRIVSGGKEVKQAEAGETARVEVEGKIHPGDRVFKNYDSLLAEKARKTFTSQREMLEIPVKFKARAAVGKPLYIEVQDSDGISGEAYSSAAGEQALQKPLDREFLMKQMSKLGNTPYRLQELHCSLDGKVAFPSREINDTRRRALEQLSQNRARARKKEPVLEQDFSRRLHSFLPAPEGPERKGQGVYTPLLTAAVSDLESLQAAVRAGADEVYFGGDGFRSRPGITPGVLEKAKNFCSRRGANLILSTPRVLPESRCSEFYPLWEKALDLPLDGILVSNLGLVERGKHVSQLPLYGDFTLNVFNRQSAAFFIERGAARVTLSPEMTLEQVGQTAGSGMPAEALVHGAVPLMVSRYCAAGAVAGGHGRNSACSGPCRNCSVRLRDRKGITFPVEMDRYCHMHIFNSREICMVDSLDQLVDCGVKAFRVDARLREAETTGPVVRVYREGLDRLAEKAYTGKFCTEAKEKLEKYSPGGFTKGHYFRGVL